MTTTTQKIPLTLCELADPGLDGIESYSPFCLKVHRALRAAGLTYQRRHGTRPDEFRKLNPRGQVPVLLVGDEAIADSTQILARIDTLGGRQLSADPDPRVRAEGLLWEEFADTSLNGFLVAARWSDDRNWPRVREAYFGAMPALLRAVLVGRIRARVLAGLHARDVSRGGTEACWERYLETLDLLEARAPAEGFWVNDSIGVADVGLFGQLHSLRTPLTPWQAAELRARPRLTAYLDRVDRATRAASN